LENDVSEDAFSHYGMSASFLTGEKRGFEVFHGKARLILVGMRGKIMPVDLHSPVDFPLGLRCISRLTRSRSEEIFLRMSEACPEHGELEHAHHRQAYEQPRPSKQPTNAARAGQFEKGSFMGVDQMK